MMQAGRCQRKEEDEARSVDLLSIPAIPSAMLEAPTIGKSYPGDPGAATLAKCCLPCGLQRLEVFVWLEESLDGQGVDIAESQEIE